MRRKDALWVMQMCRDRDARSEAEIEAFDTAIEALKNETIFSADRPRGKWIYWREDGIKRCKCSRCLTSYGCLDTPYCPNCGEKMVEGRSEE